MDLLGTFGKILSNNATRGKGGGKKVVSKTQSEIQKAQHEIAEIREKQRHQFRALSKGDQRRLCEVLGLEKLGRAWVTADETVSEFDVVATSDKQEDSQDGEGVFGETNIQEKPSRGVKSTPQLYSDQTKISHNGDYSPQGDDEQAGRQWRGKVTVQIPHKRVEALRGLAVGLPKPQSIQPPPQQRPSSLDETESQTGPQAHLNLSLDEATIEGMLRQNLERQRVLAVDLKRSKEGILKMQEDIRRAEEVEGRRLPRLDVDIEAFLRAREVMECGIAEEEDQEMGQRTEHS